MARENGARGGPARVRRSLVAPDAPGFIEAQAGALRGGVRCGRRTPRAPRRLVPRDPRALRPARERDATRPTAACTTDALLARLGWDPAQATLAYQSRFGPERWLAPATAALLEELPRRGVRSVAVVTPGFLTEGLETIEEIGAQGAETFHHAGGENFVRVPTVTDHPAFVAALAERFERSRAARA